GSARSAPFTCPEGVTPTDQPRRFVMRHFKLTRLRLLIVGSCAIPALVALLAAAAPASAQSDFRVRVDIGNAPPAPRFVLSVRPHEVYTPEERVYVGDAPAYGDEDCFHYEGFYWVFNDGYWYRARRWNGPFLVVHPRYVPTAFYRVPEERWKHH